MNIYTVYENGYKGYLNFEGYYIRAKSKKNIQAYLLSKKNITLHKAWIIKDDIRSKNQRIRVKTI